MHTHTHRSIYTYAQKNAWTDGSGCTQAKGNAQKKKKSHAINTHKQTLLASYIPCSQIEIYSYTNTRLISQLTHDLLSLTLLCFFGIKRRAMIEERRWRSEWLWAEAERQVVQVPFQTGQTCKSGLVWNSRSNSSACEVSICIVASSRGPFCLVVNSLMVIVDPLQILSWRCV